MCNFTVQYNSYNYQMPTSIYGQFYIYSDGGIYFNCSCCVIGWDISANPPCIFKPGENTSLWFPGMGPFESLTANIWGTNENGYKDRNLVTSIQLAPKPAESTTFLVRKVI